MALATQCPYCSTIFRVASDQLKLRGGIVRCGRCSQAFDGNAGLIDPATALQKAPLAEATKPAPVEAAQANHAEQAEQAAEPTPAPERPLHYLTVPDIAAAAAQNQIEHQTDLELEPEPEFDLDLDFDLDAEAASRPALEPVSDFLSTPAPERHWIDLAALTAADEERLQREALLTKSAAPSVPAPSPATEIKPEVTATAEIKAKIKPQAETEAGYWAESAARYQIEAESESEAKPEVDSEEPEFVVQGRRKQRNGKAVGVLTALGALLLLLALLAQGVMTFGSQLAAQAPQLKPALTAICSMLGCRIALPMQIKAISIELGQLQTLNASTFSYATVLHNNSSTVQAWPNIELILTDGADQAVLRRVFTPRDYLGAGFDLNSGFAARSEQALKLYFELTRINASGYHIAVFYP